MRDTVFAGYQQLEDYASEDPGSRTPPLKSLTYSYIEPEESAPQRPSRPPSVDPAEALLLGTTAPNHPELARFAHNPLSTTASSSASPDRRNSAMTDSLSDGQATEHQRFSTNLAPSIATLIPALKTEVLSGGRPHDALNARALEEKAAAAVRESEANTTRVDPGSGEVSPRARVDSAQDQVDPTQFEKQLSRSGRNTPLRLRTSLPQLLALPELPAASSIFTKHSLSLPSQGIPAPLPALQASPTITDSDVGSPKSNRLPSIRQLTNQLDQLAEAAGQQDHVSPYACYHSQSFGSTTAPSPMSPYVTVGLSAQTSPSTTGHFSFGARSPASATSDPQYGSPGYAGSARFFGHRRSSSLVEQVLPEPPSLPSASSSGSSMGHASSGAEGYSTSHSTPIESASSECPGRMTLPPSRGMKTTGYKCGFPGCNALPFLTQYLLSSHGNVHSQNRPYYCPVKQCSRSEGGKGFKRKNEMIRHGLVHNSPGYVCPFCPDREHKYPRPDNLLRHVRVHHGDKERDDPQLREVLARRCDGVAPASGQMRRRRATGDGVVPPATAEAAKAIGT